MGVVENYSFINEVPNEILLYIFKFLTVKQLMISRQVCKRWKQLLEALLADDSDWERFCNVEFSQDCRDVQRKSPNNLDFFDIYKCLSLWQRSDTAEETIDEFCHSSRVSDEIRDMNVLKGGLIIVHRRDGIVYFDVTTQAPAARERIYGDFNKVVEFGDTVLTFDGFLHLTVLKRAEIDREEEYYIEKIFSNVKYFIVSKNTIYFINMSNEIFGYGMAQKNPEVPHTFVQYHSDSQRLVSISTYNGQLHGLWIDRRVRVYRNHEFVTLFSLDTQTNLLHILWKYKFIENFDWRIYYIWMTQLRQHIPNGPLNFICTLRVYGDLFFIGSQCGVLRVYYKPFTNGELDLFNSKPIREYNFSHRIDIPILSVHPILKIEVVEILNGHKVLVAMPRKILVITLTHNSKSQVSKALVPYTNWKSIIFKKSNIGN